MLFNNNMTPAMATAGSGSYGANGRAKTESFLTKSEVDEDFNAFRTTAQRPQAAQGSPRPARPQGANRPDRQAPSKQPTRRKKPKSKPSWKLILGIGIAALVLILAIVIVVAVLFAPQKNIKMEDNVYISYIDNAGKYRLASNGKVIDQTFDGELEVIPAADRSFAYVFEKVAKENKTAYKMYILEGKKVTSIEGTADDMPKPSALADYTPGIVYKQNGQSYYYSKNDQSPICSNPEADNFIISGDASVVVYNVESEDKENTAELKYFTNGGSTKIGPYNFTPIEISKDGSYVYGIFKGVLCCVTVAENAESYEQIAITAQGMGEILGITGINVKGNEIIFCVQPANKPQPVSYMYKIGESEPRQIAEGCFTPIYADSSIVCPETFLNSYFLCTKTVTDEEENTKTLLSTYYLDKKEGARKIADTEGKFSPDKKYFYYIDYENENTLLQVKLKSKDFSADTQVVLPKVTSFEVIESGDIYAFSKDTDKGFIYFWDRSDKNRTMITSTADLDSMEVCVNSVYFSETNEDGVTKIYVSTEGSTKKEAEFKSATLVKTPEIAMGAAKKGYAYFEDEMGTTKIFYTSNGKKFSVVSTSCTIPGFTKTPAPEQKPEESEQ